VLLIIGALVAGILLGLILGGSLRNLAHLRFRWWGLAFVAVGLQFAPIPSTSGRADDWLSVGLLVASYVAVALFVAVNIRVPGVWLIGLGFALNLVAIALNGGMPVSEDALRAAYGGDFQHQLDELSESGGAKHHLAGPDDMAIPLTDVIPVGWPVRQVLSVGDIVWLVGTTWLIAGAMRAPRQVPQGPTPGRSEDRASSHPEEGTAPRWEPDRETAPPQ
jgi:Family of unknown function (DUF5317)